MKNNEPKPRPQRQPEVPPRTPATTATPPEPTDEKAAQERGERIESGKAIARGGRATGHVPGAMPSKP